MISKGKKVLIIAAHPDDEILGCGGTIAQLTQKGVDAYTLILGEGVTSRGTVRDENKYKKEIASLKTQAIAANKAIGVKKVFFDKFPDNRFDSVDLLDIVKSVEAVKRQIKPDVIFTHYGNDLNVDHRLTYQAVLTATRPLPEETVKDVYSFEVLSSTEWNYPLQFSPNVFVDISEGVEKKLKALKNYKSEMKDYPHPRSIKAVKMNANITGVKAGVPFAEAFLLVRSVK